MLSESQCGLVDRALKENIEPRKLAAYLCLHMGLTVAEATALRLEDIDLESGTLHIRNTLTRTERAPAALYEIVAVNDERIIPIPSHVAGLVKEHLHFYSGGPCFLISGEREVPGAHLLQNVLFSMNKTYCISGTLTANQLRNAFIRRCIESDVDLYTIGWYVGIKQIGELQKKFAEYLVPRAEKLRALEKYGAGENPAGHAEVLRPKRMNLLILGAGGHGKVVRETAEATGRYERIDFLDDGNPRAVGRLDEYARLASLYGSAFVAVGNNTLRLQLMNRLREHGFELPIIIHPTAHVSSTSVIQEGTIVEALAAVNSGTTIGRGCIISVGSVVDHDCRIAEGCHIDAGAVVKSMSIVGPAIKVDAGFIYDGRLENKSG